MFDFLNTPTEMHRPSAQEFALHTRKMQAEQAEAANASTVDASPRKSRKTAFIDAIIYLFGGPTLF